MKKSYATVCAVAVCLTLSASAQTPTKTGVLLLAHGGSKEWNDRVGDVARSVDRSQPTEVAFGMASRATIQAALDKLKARGVTNVVAVPLFVSSWSSVITSTEYLLGVRAKAPPELKLFAKMDHSAPGAAAEPGDHAGHAMADPASPVSASVPIRITPAFNRHALIGEVLVDRARGLSKVPAAEAVILLAHGPVPDDDNRLWLADMAVLADHVKVAVPFASVEYMTVRDDAGPAMREVATQELRGKVEAQQRAGRRVLIVPHVMSFGGIEQGMRKRLEGLEYTMAEQGLIPDDRIVQWVLSSIK
jgi:sirohydrochlorin ferrochelatase